MAPILDKAQARQLVYRRLRQAGAARFPFPIEGRIPNFVGAEQAARRLRELPVYRQARAVKVNPDAPQLPVRAAVLEDGKVLYMPTPRLRGSFVRIRPEDVPAGHARRAASLAFCRRYGAEVRLDDPRQAFGPVDLVVAGSVAVTREGARAGKGEGYSDLEYAILRELGHPDVPVVTTVHPLQMVDGLVMEAHDLPVDYIVTPQEIIETRTPYPKPTGIDWARVTEEDLREMPVLMELRRARWQKLTVPDVLQDGLRVLFVGLNPGRHSAARGHHFAGPGNHFWRLLHDAGLTPRRLAPEEDRELLRYGIGVTNLVGRASRGEEDLSWEEMQAGAQQLRAKVAQARPRLVVLLGAQVYRAYAGLPRRVPVRWGLQPRETVPGVAEFAAANPSSRSTVPYAVRLGQFREIRRLMGPALTAGRGPQGG